jgi:hypothetical protein
MNKILFDQGEFIDTINKSLYEKLLAISFFEKENLINVLNNVLGEGISHYQKRNGENYLKLWRTYRKNLK